MQTRSRSSNPACGLIRKQPPENEGFQIKLDADLVTIDAVVRDNRRAFIGDLKAEDYVVLDNDVPKRVTRFSCDRFPMAAAMRALIR